MKTIFSSIKPIILVVSLLAITLGLRAQGTSFTYQGRLSDAGQSANGIYDLQFAIYDLPGGGTVAGGPLTNAATAVRNGLFTVTLDFGANVFTGADRWLDIGVRSNGSGAFILLSPRQKLTPAPYAITAGNVTGVLPNGGMAGTYSSAVTFDNAANQFTGSFAGNGGGLSNVNALTLGGLTPSVFWQLGGNHVAPGQFLGSTNNQPVELRVNGQRALRLEPNTNGAPNVIGGSPLNQTDAGVVAATIGGGGSVNYFGTAYSNRVAADFGTIGGGANNTIQDQSFGSSIAGGFANAIQTASGNAVIGGGSGNIIARNAGYSVIAGGGGNVVLPDVFASGILSGYSNTNGSAFAGIGGGIYNTIHSNSSSSFIGGGYLNVIHTNSGASVIAGGQENTIEANAGMSSIGGGWLNFVQSGADQSVVAGGNANRILSSARESFIGGGFANTVGTNASVSFLGGGTGNVIGTNSAWGTIAGGQDNSIQAGASHATIGGGTANINSGGGAFIGGGIVNRAENFDTVVVGGGANVNAGYRAFIGSGEANFISNSASYATITAGRLNTNNSTLGTIGGGGANRILGSTAGVIGGGQGNSISNAGPYSTISGGLGNEIQNGATHGFIGGGFENTVRSFAFLGTIAGGLSNVVSFGAQYGTIGGGRSNVVASLGFVGGGDANTNNGFAATIVGGQNNNIGSLADHSVIAGGGDNRIVGSQSLPVYATISGGQLNAIQTNAIFSTIGGGAGNTVQTNAQYATIPGGAGNSVAGRYSFAAGNRASALHDGTFVWADADGTNFSSTASNQFLIRAGGGVGIGKTNPVSALDVNGVVTAAGFSGSGATLSSVNATTLGGLASSGFWQTSGNAGTTAGVNFLGTTDFQPLEFRVDNLRALRIEPPGFSSAPNIVGGQGSFVAPGLVGNFIGNGSADAGSNFIMAANFNVIGGGYGNRITSGFDNFIGSGQNNTVATPDRAGVIGGGSDNLVTGSYATVPGGMNNTASGDKSFAAGNRARANHQGSFVWADSTDADFTSTAADQFLVRAGFVGINRTNPVTGADVFAVRSPATSGYGGMYVDTAGANGWPFYGYAAAGTAVAWTYVDGSDGGKWKLSVGGIDSLAVTPGGNVGIGTTSPSAMLHVSGPVQIGSGTGSAEPPDKPIIIRRVKSTINTAGSVVARTDKLSLERDGSNGGWRIANVASPGSTTIAATGLTSTGGTVNFVNFLNGNSEAGITTIFSESQSIASFRCTFGDTATPGHLTEVSLIRGVNNYWTGTMTSTFNQ